MISNLLKYQKQHTFLNNTEVNILIAHVNNIIQVTEFTVNISTMSFLESFI